MRRADWEISPEELFKRMSKWKPKTLFAKLEKVGASTYYKPSYIKQIINGKRSISPKAFKSMFKVYQSVMTNIPKALAELESAEEVTPELISEIASLFGLPVSFLGALLDVGKWLSIDEWLIQSAHKDSSLNIEFSLARLTMRGVHFVYTIRKKLVFANKKVSGKPRTDQPLPQQLVYSIMVDDAGTIETWVQPSAPGLYYGDPLSNEARINAEQEVGEMQERNEEMGGRVMPSKEVYAWWNHGADNSLYTFLGIGVTLT